MGFAHKTLYVDYNQATSGTGTRINPYNSLLDIYGTGKTLPDGSTDIRVKAGNFVTASVARDVITPGNRVWGTALDFSDRKKKCVYGVYGDGAGPDGSGRFILDSGVARSLADFLQDGVTGLWYKQYSNAGTVPQGYTQVQDIGCVRQGGRLLSDAYFLKRFSRSQNNAAGAPTLTEAQVKQQLLDNPGSFAYFPEVTGSQGTLWVNPVGGFTRDTNLYVAEYANGMSLGLPMTGTMIDSWGIWGCAQNGIQINGSSSAPYIANLSITNCHVMAIGGAFLTQTTFFGNGIQASVYAPNLYVGYCVADQIFDSPFTSQVYTTNANISYADYDHCIARDYGLSAFEISLTGGASTETNSQRVLTNVTVRDCIAMRGGQGWSGQRYGVGGGMAGSSINVNPVGIAQNVKLLRNKAYDLLAPAFSFNNTNGAQLLAVANQAFNCAGGIKILSYATRLDQNSVSVTQAAMFGKIQGNLIVGGANSNAPGIQIGAASATDHTGSVFDTQNNTVAYHPIGIDLHLPSTAANLVQNNLIVHCPVGMAKDGTGLITKNNNLIFDAVTAAYQVTNGATLVQGNDLASDPLIDFKDSRSLPSVVAFSPAARGGITNDRLWRWAVDGSHPFSRPNIGAQSQFNGS